jgi:hypothetical protein
LISKCWHQCIRNEWPFLSALAELRKATVSFFRSVCLTVHSFTWNNSAPSGRIFMQVDNWLLFENLSRIYKFH